MSGSNGDSFGGGGVSNFSCNNVYIITTVVSPDPTVLKAVTVGETLKVSLQSPTGPLVLITNSGDILGSIFPSDLAALIQCISDGNSYEAEIKNIAGAKVTVLIT